MQQELSFHKYEGAGNDFIVVDDRAVAIPEGDSGRALFARLCDRRRGIGADGVLLLRPPVDAGTDFRMRYFNADGGEAEMCGNGARCLARFAHTVGAAGDRMSFRTEAGIYRAEIRGERVAVAFPDLSSPLRACPLEAAGARWDADFVEAGVPHLVAWVADTRSVDLPKAGRALRFHEDLAPRGANANFAQTMGPASVRLRTYERGVEGETLACGTGAVATAISSAWRAGTRGAFRVELVPTGGDTLEVEGVLADNGLASGLWLIGPAREVFSGNVAL